MKHQIVSMQFPLMFMTVTIKFLPLTGDGVGIVVHNAHIATPEDSEYHTKYYVTVDTAQAYYDTLIEAGWS